MINNRFVIHWSSAEVNKPRTLLSMRELSQSKSYFHYFLLFSRFIAAKPKESLTRVGTKLVYISDLMESGTARQYLKSHGSWLYDQAWRVESLIVMCNDEIKQIKYIGRR